MKLYSKQYAGTDRLLNPDFKYVHSSQTDIGKRFKEMQAQAKLANQKTTKSNVYKVK